MAQLVPIPFWLETAEARSSAVSGERLRNWYVEKSPEGAKSPLALYPTPGLSLQVAVGDGPIRGIGRVGSLLYVVSGSKLYTVTSTLTVTEIGDIANTGSVRMTNNETHVVICTTNHAYAANEDGVVTLPESNLNGAAYQDGYGLYTQAGTQFLWWSDLDDLTAIGGTNFTSADAHDGTVVGVVSDHREVWVFKDRSAEIFYNDGATPFVRSQAGFIERGCLAPGSIAKVLNAVIWLGDDYNVHLAGGHQPKPISPPWVVKAIEGQSSPQTAEAFTYSQDGHTFYVLTFSGLTLCYDMTMGRWHERLSSGCDRWRAQCHCSIWGKEIVGDYANGNLYALDLETYDDNGEHIRREAISAPVHAGGNRAFMHEFFVDLQPGVGLVSGQGDDPDLIVDWSDDGGNTWSNERHVKIGAVGEYGTQARTYRCGSFRSRQMRIAVTDPVKVVVLGGFAQLEGGLT